MNFEMPRGAKPVHRHNLAASDPYRSEADSVNYVPSGTFPSPDHELALARPFRKKDNHPHPHAFLIWPRRLDSYVGNLASDSCWIEEAFAMACVEPNVYIPNDVLQQAIIEAGSTNFSQFMRTRGFRLDGHTYLSGSYYSVNWADRHMLQNAIYHNGPVKIGVAAGKLKSNTEGLVTPSIHGWAMYNYPSGESEDHCASLCGYGSKDNLAELIRQQGVTLNLPDGMPATFCYAIFVWNSIGIIDEQSMLNMTGEAWVRDPVTITS